MIRTIFLSLGLLPFVLLAEDWTWPPSEDIASRVETTLERHYEGEALRTWLGTAETREREALEFLLAWLPAPDLGAWSADALIENVRIALETWRPEVDAWTFHSFVLPHRVSQEPPQNWRRVLREMIGERTEGMSLSEAALEVNRFCREWATYRASSRRDQPALTTLERGIGRCEEETILLISALRSVGIPARQCYTPYWTTGDSNHAWVEVFTGDAWHYMGSCEPAACLDRAWFSNPTQRAGLVLSNAYGEMPLPSPEASRLYRQANGATVLNTTEVYTDPGELLVTLPGEQEAEWVWIHVFNFASPSVLGRVRPGERIFMGRGDYLLTAEAGGQPYSALAEVRPGKLCDLELHPGLTLLENPVWLRYGPSRTGDAPEDCEVSPEDPLWKSHQDRLDANDAARKERARLPEGWKEALAGHSSSEEIRKTMEEAGPAPAKWAHEILALKAPEKSLALNLLAEMDIKSYYEFDPAGLQPLLAEILRVRALAPSLPDSIFDPYVLSPWLYHQAANHDTWTEIPWRGVLSAEELLQAFRTRVKKADEGRLGHVATPGETWRSGWSDEAGAKACLVGLFRRHGLPARAVRGVPTVGVWQQGNWQEFLPFEDASSDDDTPGMAEEAFLLVRYFENGQPYENVETWRQTRLNLFREGRFEPWYLGQISEGEGIVDWNLPAGEYWLMGGLRNSLGEPRFVSRKLDIAAGDSLFLEMDIGIPLAERDDRNLLPYSLSEDFRLKDRRPYRSFLKEVSRGRRLLVLVLGAHEPSRRQLAALEGMELELLWLDDMVGHAPEGPWRIGRESVERVFHVKDPVAELPISILLEEGETRLWIEGLEPGLKNYLREN
ncbi:MAG: transglutaminase-like domain-containing protein [Candidatus Krumholzibacteria bacterium]|jgi:hypothetical protein|nr:transglutaminase-like domain-containing protein [Candidatus Krumholzibacteria bacterium]